MIFYLGRAGISLFFMAKRTLSTNPRESDLNGWEQVTRTGAFDHGSRGCWAPLRRLSAAYFDLDDNRSSANVVEEDWGYGLCARGAAPIRCFTEGAFRGKGRTPQSCLSAYVSGRLP
jgi:hypothetical protein